MLLDGQKICYEVTSDKRSRHNKFAFCAFYNSFLVEVQTELGTYMYMCCGSNLILLLFEFFLN